jgi:DNA-binding MarR family transcriptional regulator
VYDREFEFELDGRVGAGFDEYLFYLFMQTVNRRNRDFNPALSAVGLSIAEWRAMAVINRLDGCLMSELAEFTTVDRTTLTRTIDHLSAKELTVRVASPQDRRQVRVELTAQGRIVIDQAVNALRTHNERALSGLSDDELTTLRALLQRILRNLIEKPEHFHRIVRFER